MGGWGWGLGNLHIASADAAPVAVNLTSSFREEERHPRGVARVDAIDRYYKHTQCLRKYIFNKKKMSDGYVTSGCD